MDHIVNNILLIQNLTYMLKAYKIYTPTIKFLKYLVILKFLKEVIDLSYNQVCSQIFSFFYINFFIFLIKIM